MLKLEFLDFLGYCSTVALNMFGIYLDHIPVGSPGAENSWLNGSYYAMSYIKLHEILFYYNTVFRNKQNICH